jgi:5'-methylthioadenosine phosphorylase
MELTRKPVLGIIGGSGIYDIDGLKKQQWIQLESGFGQPSDELLFGVLNDVEVVFLPRHGRMHQHSPSSINYRANIDCLKKTGVGAVISVSAVGSLREDFRPGDFVLIDQFVDRTFKRENSFFGSGCVAHVSIANPVCEILTSSIAKAADAICLKYHRGGTYLAMEGPQFSTLAESETYRKLGMDVIGMTNMPEAKLAREAELCFASVSMVTDYDCWHPDHENVQVADIIEVLNANAVNAGKVLEALIPVFASSQSSIACAQGCNNALDNSLITRPEGMKSEVLAQLETILHRVLNKAS